jgi:putative membrane protein
MIPMWGCDNLLGMLLWFVIILLFWVGVIGLVVTAIRGIIQPSQKREERGGSSFPIESPLDILKKRYARDEITREEFLEARRDLKD